MKKLFLALIFILLLSSPCWAVTYHYVNHGLATGNNDGSSWANAWKDVDNINWSTLSGEAAATQPVYLYFKKGVTITADSFSITAGGSSETNRIILTTDPSDTGTTPTFDGTGLSGRFIVASSGVHYLTFQNLKFINGSEAVSITYVYSAGPSTVTNNYWTWEDCTFKDIQGQLFGSNNSPYVTANGWVFRRCLFDAVATYISTPERHVFYIENSDNWLIEYCKFVGCPNDVIMWRDGSDNWILRYNYFENCGKNVARQAMQAGYQDSASSGAVIYGNIFNDCNIGIYLRNGHTVTAIYNNVFYNSVQYGILQDATGDLINLRNNIFYRPTTSSRCLYFNDAGITNESNNLYYIEGTNMISYSGSYTTVAAWNTGPGTSAITGNPLFNNAAGDDFSLTASSPAKDAGYTIGSPYNEGLPVSWQWNVGSEGGKVSPTLITRSVGVYDIGAYEYVEGSPTWGYPSPPTGLAISWLDWEISAGVKGTIIGDPNWGALQIDSDTTYKSSVIDTGNIDRKTFTVQKDLYDTGSGSVKIYIRGNTTSFNQHDVSPSWNEYTIPTTQNWRYVQLKIELVP